MKNLDLNQMENCLGGDVQCEGLSESLGLASTLWGGISLATGGIAAPISFGLGVAAGVAWLAGC